MTVKETTCYLNIGLRKNRWNLDEIYVMGTTADRPSNAKGCIASVKVTVKLDVASFVVPVIPVEVQVPHEALHPAVEAAPVVDTYRGQDITPCDDCGEPSVVLMNGAPLCMVHLDARLAGVVRAVSDAASV